MRFLETPDGRSGILEVLDEQADFGICDERLIARYLQGSPVVVLAAWIQRAPHYGELLFTTRDTIKRAPECVLAFREASLRGWEYANYHIEEAVDLYCRRIVPSADRDTVLREAETRAATPEEIEHLQELERKRVRRRMTVGLSVAIPLVVLALIFRPRRPPPEVEIEWPKDAAGSYLDQFEPAPSGGYKEGGFDVCYPGNGTFKRKAIEGGMMLDGFIGRSMDVPMRVVVQEEREVRFAGLSRAAAVEDWMQQVADSGGRWNFDRPSPTPAFFGRKNGIPYTRVTYLRDGDGTWFGVASVVLYGDRRLVARTEVPATERMRAEKMMSVKLIRPADVFEFAYWEGVPGAASLDESAMLRQIRGDLERIAPATWAALESLLQSLLTQAVQAGHREVETEALALLVKLRERQALWFNSQKLAFDAAMMQNNWKKAEKVAEFTKAVYSRVEDQRYFDVRKWKAGP